MSVLPRRYNPGVQIEEFRIVLALEPSWTISINGREFLHVRSSEITIEGERLRFERFSRTILELEALRGTVVRVRTRTRMRSRTDTLLFYAGEQLPSAAGLRRRRTAFQRSLVPAVERYFGTRVTRQTLHSDKRHGIGGAYPRLLAEPGKAVIAVDPDEDTPVINGILRAAIQWSGRLKRRVTVVVPVHRSQTILTRLRALPRLHKAFDWLAWDGAELAPLDLTGAEPETYVQAYRRPAVDGEVDRILRIAPDVLQAVPHIAGSAVSIRLRGIEVARVGEQETEYPL